MRKPTLVFRGLRRQLLRKLQNSLLSIEKMDLRESLLAGERGVDGDYFANGDTSKEAKAVQTLLDRIDAVLILKK